MVVTAMMLWWLRQTIRLLILLALLTVSMVQLGRLRSSDVFIYSARVNHKGVTSEIRLYDRRTGLTYAITYGHQITQVSLTSDGNSVVYGQFAGISRYELEFNQSQLIRADDNTMPLVAPNGTWIAYQSLNTSMLNARDTLQVIDNAGYTHHDLQLRATAWTWFPDSTRLTFAVLDGNAVNLSWLDIETSAVTHVATIPYIVRDMDWSPDGTMLLMSDGNKLLSYDRATGTINILYESSSYLLITPHWSSDGTRILWLSDNYDGEYRLVLATAQGVIIEAFVLEDMTILNRVDWWHLDLSDD
jgi:hypothetical protein